MWSEDCKEEMRDCPQDTVSDTIGFFMDAHKITHTISSHMKFCEDHVCWTKTVSIFPNNTGMKEPTVCLNEKKMASCSGDSEFSEKRRRLQEK